jgi:hypothetical protein
MRDLRHIFDNPGPFAKKTQAPTFEEHLQQVYYKDGFVLELRNGEEWVVKSN